MAPVGAAPPAAFGSVAPVPAVAVTGAPAEPAVPVVLGAVVPPGAALPAVTVVGACVPAEPVVALVCDPAPATPVELVVLLPAAPGAGAAPVGGRVGTDAPPLSPPQANRPLSVNPTSTLRRQWVRLPLRCFMKLMLQ